MIDKMKEVAIQQFSNQQKLIDDKNREITELIENKNKEVSSVIQERKRSLDEKSKEVTKITKEKDKEIMKLSQALANIKEELVNSKRTNGEIEGKLQEALDKVDNYQALSDDKDLFLK